MPEKDIKLGTAANDSKEAEAPDMDRYYYPPGATEPVLRPGVSDQPEAKDQPVQKGSVASAPSGSKRTA